MPTACLRPCTYPQCGELVKSGRCAAHAKATQRAADAERPNREQRREYNTARWKKLRALKLSRDPLCGDCKKNGIITPATDVDHIERVQDGGAMWSWDNLASRCHACHSRKTADEVWRGRRDTVREGRGGLNP